jgi:hypothetical protein
MLGDPAPFLKGGTAFDFFGVLGSPVIATLRLNSEYISHSAV